MKIFIVVALLSLTTAAFSADQPPQGQGQYFEQHKADVLKRINARIARNQEELSCVQAAQNHNDLKACREKFREESKEAREQNQGQHKGQRQQY